MIFGGRSLQDLTIADYETLVLNRTAESPFLDFKANAYGGRADSIREMLRDIVAIANAEGGYIIRSIQEDAKGRAEAFVPVPDVHSRVQPIRQVCLDGIWERIEGLEIAAFECAPDQGIIAIRIPKGEQRPNMVVLERDGIALTK